MYAKIENIAEGKNALRIRETRTIAGHTYSTIEHGNAMLVRKARQDYPEAGVSRGDVYVEYLTDGAHNTGARFSVTEAVELGYLVIDEPLYNWNGSEWVPA